ncbi:MAG: hypothetical protein WED10_00410 [Brumimicrobium sp.]
MFKGILKSLTVLLCLIITNQKTFSQITGGGKVGVNKEAPEVVENEKFKNSTYITLNFAKAIGKFSNSVKDVKSFKKRHGGMNRGMGFSVGRIFYLNSIDVSRIGLNDQFKIGIDANYFNYTFINGYEAKNEGTLFENNYTHFISIGLGGILSYNPVGKLILDFKIGLEPGFVTYDYSKDSYYDEYDNQYFRESFFGESFALRKKIGLYARYRPFTVGFCVNWGRVNLNAEHKEYKEYNTYDSFYNEYTTTMDPEYSSIRNVKTSTMRFDFVIGFTF